MRKINTKNILKKIFKAKPKKKVKKKDIEKKINKTKKIIKNKTKKVIAKKTKKIAKKISPKSVKTKKVTKISETKEATKVDNLRISKSNEVKPEIKKVKKNKIEVWCQEIRGIIYYIDAKNNIYSVEDILNNVDVPKVVGHWSLQNNEYVLSYN